MTSRQKATWTAVSQSAGDKEKNTKFGDSNMGKIMSSKKGKRQTVRMIGKLLPRKSGGDEGRDLKRLLDYELRSAARYRRFVSLLMVTPAKQGVKLHQVLREHVRSSDEYFELDGEAAILMGETDSSEALQAANRYLQLCNGDIDLRFAVASYPSDARVASDLLSTVHRRLAVARSGAEGAIICQE